MLDCVKLFSSGEEPGEEAGKEQKPSKISLRKANEQSSQLSHSADDTLSLLVDFGTSPTVSLATLAGSVTAKEPHFLVLKQNGCLQIWSARQRRILDRFYLGLNGNEKYTCLAAHPSMPLFIQIQVELVLF